MQLFSNGMRESEQRHVSLRINASGRNVGMYFVDSLHSFASFPSNGYIINAILFMLQRKLLSWSCWTLCTVIPWPLLQHLLCWTCWWLLTNLKLLRAWDTVAGYCGTCLWHLTLLCFIWSFLLVSWWPMQSNHWRMQQSSIWLVDTRI